jgi:polysaccharide biosynthesis transport protein
VTEPGHEPTGATLREYLAVIWRWKWVGLAVIVAATAAAYAFAAVKTPMYAATAKLLYERPLDVSNPLAGTMSWVDPSLQALDVESVSTVVASPELSSRVEEDVGSASLASADYAVSAAAEPPGASSDYTNVAMITAVSSDPEHAAVVANAYAAAFIEWRKERQREQVKKARTVLAAKLASYEREGLGQDTDYLFLQSRLRDLEILEATVTGDFALIEPAVVPSVPYEPRPMRSAVLGFGVGLFAAIGLAFLLEQFNTRLRDYREPAELLGMPVLGRIPQLPRECLDEDPLIVVRFPDGHGAEAFRMLRGNLEFVGIGVDVHSFFVTSCLQGEGKSTTVANLAATLALAGKNVIVVDGDMRRPWMHSHFGLDNERGLSTVLSGQVSASDCLQEATLHLGTGCEDTSERARRAVSPQTDPAAPVRIRVLAAGPQPPNPGELIASKRFGDVIHELEGLSDVVVVDSPAMMVVGDAAPLAGAVDGLLMLVDMEKIRRPTLRESRDVLDPLPCRKLGLIVVRERLRHKDYYRYGYSGYGREGGERRHGERRRAPGGAAIPRGEQA